MKMEKILLQAIMHQIFTVTKLSATTSNWDALLESNESNGHVTIQVDITSYNLNPDLVMFKI